MTSGRPAAPLAVIRADGGPRTGLGHVIRCLALAEHLRLAGWRIGFAADKSTWRSVPSLALAAPEALTFEEDVAAADAEAKALKARWRDGVDLLIVDHYGRDRAFESACQGWAEQIVVLDDLCDRRHEASVILDATPGRSRADYEGLVPDKTLRLTGAQFALLRPEFRRLRGRAMAALVQAPAQVRRILVGLGGGDARNLTRVALEALALAGVDCQVEVIVGAANPHGKALAAICKELPFPVALAQDVRDMADRLLLADLVVGGLGTSALERCCLARPSVGLVAAENQMENASGLRKAGAAAVVGAEGPVERSDIVAAVEPLIANREARIQMAQKAAMLCDGLGAWRLICTLAGRVADRQARPVALRMATAEDGALMYDWQCHPEVRKFSRNPKPPSRAGHERWLRDCLVDPGRILTLLEVAGLPAGALRFDLRDKDEPCFEVSILVAPEQQTHGIGRAALMLARRLLPGASFLAEVDPRNEASRRLFLGCGYRPDGPRHLTQTL